jgi:hypothetical protein
LLTEALEVVGRCCPLLKSLKFNSWWEKNGEYDEEALAIAENMSELRCPQLFGNMLTNDSLQAILDGCPHLDHLTYGNVSVSVLQGIWKEDVLNRLKTCVFPIIPLMTEFNAYCSFDDVSGGFSDTDHFSNTFFKKIKNNK